MSIVSSIRTRRAPGCGIALLLLGAALPAHAQSSAAPGVTARVDRLEKEMRAVQRKVFPGGEQAMLAPEISAPVTSEAAGQPASAPIADLTARVSSLEQALAQLTGQVEQNGFRLKQLEDQFGRFRGDAESRLGTLEGGAPAARPGTVPATSPTRPRSGAAAPSTDALETGASTAGDTGATAPDVAGAAPSGDPAEDAYLTGYRAWAAKDYPAAEAGLKAYTAKYPTGKRASYAQNLLGRTYLDSGRPAAAAVAFHHNYTTNPRGDRAPDSLYYLGQALMALDKPQPAKACEAYDTLSREYGTTLAAALKDKLPPARKAAKCGTVAAE